ncbi:MAG: YIP1 family protein [Dysgonamonadaceae bacterium]|jgi:hypothetical protein|nr:YIP1 family protein [Dysgonamonadaceae bacterium]
MYKQLFILLYKIITVPASTWKFLSEKQDNKDNETFYKGYLFPVIGIIALLSFMGVIISLQRFDVQQALKITLKEIMIYGGSFYLVSFVLSEYVYPRFGLKKNKRSAELFTGYASSPIYVIAMLKTIFPALFFLEILSLYTIYVVWTGAAYFLNIKEEQWIKFATFAGLLIVMTPFLLNFLINLLMPGMKI